MPDLLDRYVTKRAAISPKIYAYSDTRFPGCLKIGYTTRSVRKRMHEQYPTITPGQSYHVEFQESAVRGDGTIFKDHDLHRVLKRMPSVQHIDGEWFCCKLEDVKAALIAVRDRNFNVENKTQDFSMRPEQKKSS